MRKFKVYVNEEFEEEKALMELCENEEIHIMQGDYYHDKIDEKIDSFFMALEYLGIDGIKDSEVLINHNDEIFDELCFNQEWFDEE